MQEDEQDYIIITGATGYIGKQILIKLLENGANVICLGRCPEELRGQTKLVKWRLGEQVKIPKSIRVKTIIHLAHDWKTQITNLKDDTNYEGTKKLVSWSRKNKVNKFIFVSSIAAKDTSLNRYGRIKANIEKLMKKKNEISVRVGLVYGGANEGMWLQLLNLTKNSPIIPMVKPGALVQPIFYEDLICSFLSIIQKKNIDDKIICLASATPVKFGSFLKQVAKSQHDKTIFILPIGLGAALFAIKIYNFLPFKEKLDKERVLGLAGISFYDTLRDIKKYSFKIRPLSEGLSRSIKEKTKALEK